MSTVLRASGPTFDVDAFVTNCPWNIEVVFRRGEALFPGARPDMRRRETSGLHVVVSNAGLHDFDEQVQDAIEFLTTEADEVRRLVAFSGVDGVCLDIGIAWRDVAAQTDHLPAALIRLAGACGISLALSHYPVASDSEPTEQPPL